MHCLKFSVFALVLLTVIQVCHGGTDNTTKSGTEAQGNVVTDNTENEKSSLEKGMEPIFDLYKNFLKTVMPDSFYDDKTDFNVQKLTDIIKKQSYGDLQKDWQDLVKTFGGFAACIFMGLIFFFFMPIIGMIYCCCHCCCHKCGGTKEQNDPKMASCKRMTYASLLLIFTTLMLAGGIITFLGSELLHQSLKNENNKGLMGELDTNLGAMQTYATDTIKDVKQKSEEDVIVNGLNKILPLVEGAVNETVNKVKGSINATSLLNEAKQLGDAAQKAMTDIENVNDTVTNLQELQTNVTTVLLDVQSSVQKLNCSFLACDVTRLAFKPNFTILGNLQVEMGKVDGAQNITKFVDDAEQEFYKAFDNVDTKVTSYVNDSKKLIDDMRTTINKSLNNLDGQAKPFVDALQEGRDFANKSNGDVQEIGKYTWYTCIGLGCLVMLVVFFYYLGVLFGLCGERPSHTAACCNRGTGANLLCTGICCTFLFAWILMLVVILLFMMGGLGYTMACRYIDSGIENVDVFENVLSNGFNWNISASFGVKNLTVSQMFKNCKADQGVYTALHLNDIFDIDAEFNVTDLRKKVHDMGDISAFTLDNVTLLSTDLKNQLETFSNSGLSAVNFTSYTEQLDKEVLDFDLTRKINELENASAVANQTSQQSAAILSDAAQKLKNLQNNQLKELDTTKARLRTAVTDLEKDSDISAQVTSLISNINKSQDQFNSDKESIVEEGLKGAVEQILDLIDNTVNSTKDSIKNDVGKCKPLYDAAQNVVNAGCEGMLDPLNAIWFGLGWALFFYIPAFIFAAMLASLYKRTDAYKKKQGGFDDANHDDYMNGYQGGHRGYGGGNHDDNIPLTSGNNHAGRSKDNAAYNPGYEGRELAPETRFHRDDAYRGGDHGRGPMYAKPYGGERRDHYDNDHPPRYDEATSPGYPHGNMHDPLRGVSTNR